MVYADEEFYKNEYLLGRKAAISSGFPFYARQASQIMDQYTFGRLTIICRQEKTEKNASGKTSEKIGTYSASYGSSQELTEAAIRKQNQIVKKWLENTGLCYQGVC